MVYVRGVLWWCILRVYVMVRQTIRHKDKVDSTTQRMRNKATTKPKEENHKEPTAEHPPREGTKNKKQTKIPNEVF